MRWLLLQTAPCIHYTSSTFSCVWMRTWGDWGRHALSTHKNHTVRIRVQCPNVLIGKSYLQAVTTQPGCHVSYCTGPFTRNISVHFLHPVKSLLRTKCTHKHADMCIKPTLTVAIYHSPANNPMLQVHPLSKSSFPGIWSLLQLFHDALPQGMGLVFHIQHFHWKGSEIHLMIPHYILNMVKPQQPVIQSAEMYQNA